MGEGRTLKHVQVREYVRGLVKDAAPGSPAPSERELVHHFGVARMTVRQAMDALVVEGLLERIPGRGTFVAHPRREVGRLIGYTEEMARRGLLGESQTLLARREQAGPGVARALSITEGDAVIHWKRLRRADGVPDVHRGRLPQRGADSRLPAERHADQPVRRARVARPAADLGRGLHHRRPGQRRGGRDARDRRGQSPCSGSRAGLCRARRSWRCRARSTVPTASRCGCSWVKRACRARPRAAPGVRSRALTPRRPRPDPDRRGPAGCAARAPVTSPQVRHTGQRPTVSNNAS